MTELIQVCPGCGLETEAIDGPTHPYIGASAGCWQRHSELLVTGSGGQLAVDTYAVQHPGVEERRSVQSVAVHLMSMCAALERGLDPGDAIGLIRRVLATERAWWWLTHETPIGTITVHDVLEGDASLATWASDVWTAWSAHHETIRAWLDEARAA